MNSHEQYKSCFNKTVHFTPHSKTKLKFKITTIVQVIENSRKLKIPKNYQNCLKKIVKNSEFTFIADILKIPWTNPVTPFCGTKMGGSSWKWPTKMFALIMKWNDRHKITGIMTDLFKFVPVIFWNSMWIWRKKVWGFWAILFALYRNWIQTLETF